MAEHASPPGQDFAQSKKAHENALFPFCFHSYKIPEDFVSLPLHRQDTMELLFIRQGSGLAQVGLHVLEARAGDIFVLPPGTLHGLRQNREKRMECVQYRFPLSMLGGGNDICAQKYLLPLQSGRLTLPVRLSLEDAGYAPAAACLTEAEELCRIRRMGYELGIKGAMLRFLATVLALQNLPPTLPDSGDDRRLQALLQRVEDDCAAPFPVAQAAALCGCSASHFMRWFKRMTGTSFAAYLNERRLATAAELLRTGSDTILSVAEQVGFENLSNFNRQFKARYGMTPRQYRKAE